MTARCTASLVFLSLVYASSVVAQETPLSEFQSRVAEYVALRDTVETSRAGLHDAAQLDGARRALADRLRVGDFITPSVARELVARLRPQLDGPTWASLMADNPGEFPLTVGGEYPAGRPHSTMPATVLDVLPPLPDGIEYRFAGRHLLLFDARANLILDYIPYALAVCDCEEPREDLPDDELDF